MGWGRPKKIANVETPKEEPKPKPLPVNTPQEIKKAIEVPEVMEEEEERRNWLTNLWIGKALKRLNLITAKRRLGEGVEVMLNVSKANEKMKIFR